MEDDLLIVDSNSGTSEIEVSNKQTKQILLIFAAMLLNSSNQKRLY